MKKSVDSIFGTSYTISCKIIGAPLSLYPKQAAGRGLRQFNDELVRLKWPGYREVRGVPMDVATTLGRFVFGAH